MLEKFKSDGYLVLKGYLDTASIENCFSDLVKNHDCVLDKIQILLEYNLIDIGDVAIESGKIKYLKNANLYFKTINNTIDSKLYALAEVLLGENSFVDGVELHQKYPGTSGTPPHQDNFYFCLRDMKSLTMYIPLNHQEKVNGALAVLPGSHKKFFEHYPSSVTGFSSGFSLTDEQQGNVDNYILDKGDLSVHHCNIVHMASENLSDIPRINIAVRFKSIKEKVDPFLKNKYDSFRLASTRIKD